MLVFLAGMLAGESVLDPCFYRRSKKVNEKMITSETELCEKVVFVILCCTVCMSHY